jgi:hypothetical protein
MQNSEQLLSSSSVVSTSQKQQMKEVTNTNSTNESHVNDSDTHLTTTTSNNDDLKRKSFSQSLQEYNSIVIVVSFFLNFMSHFCLVYYVQSILSPSALQTDEGKARAKRMLELEAYSAVISAFRSQGKHSSLSLNHHLSFIL